MNKEKSHMQGYVFLNFPFLAVKAKQKKGDRKKPHCETDRKTPTQFPGTEQTPRNHEKMPFSV